MPSQVQSRRRAEKGRKTAANPAVKGKISGTCHYALERGLAAGRQNSLASEALWAVVSRLLAAALRLRAHVRPFAGQSTGFRLLLAEMNLGLGTVAAVCEFFLLSPSTT
jgi:hypothetical protein